MASGPLAEPLERIVQPRSIPPPLNRSPSKARTPSPTKKHQAPKLPPASPSKRAVSTEPSTTLVPANTTNSTAAAGTRSSSPLSAKLLSERRRRRIFLLLDGVDVTGLPQMSHVLHSKDEEKNLVDRMYNHKPRILSKFTPEEKQRIAADLNKSPFHSRSKKLDSDTLQDMAVRMTQTEMQRRQDKREKLEQKYYQVQTDRRVLTKEEQDEACDRLFYNEMSNRQEAREEKDASMYEEEPRVLCQEDLDESLRRVYYDASDRAQENLRSLQQRYEFQRRPGKALEKEAIEDLANRLSKPKQRYDDPKNPYYGATHLS
eukprot:NODE_901_length_1125_cov_61.285571_g859_i0.p1 GENE.NODE_901_length_1125_cov_61.285571_g859_i0~~NODE_901_length_1125_cov_61.285571_g859_i0.p1  ORF type:complete len:317 (-),score=35.39 NODE_901_length_1125_cov_61.285571_g859_i0:91-1041(-)